MWFLPIIKTIHNNLPNLSLIDGEFVEGNYKKRLKKIHEEAHTENINKYPDNKVLNTRPPAINIKEEKTT